MSTKFEKASSMIDAAHAEDPKTVVVGGDEVPYELHYARKMSGYLEKRMPNAPETVKLAVRAQHFRRWEVPRDSYPMTKIGAESEYSYHSWRTFLKKRQADLASVICASVGYSAEECSRITSMIRKENLKVDEEAQALEDVACLVFLDDQFEQFQEEHDEEKIISILRKTWAKMSERGRHLAIQIPMSGRPQALIEKALSA